MSLISDIVYTIFPMLYFFISFSAETSYNLGEREWQNYSSGINQQYQGYQEYFQRRRSGEIATVAKFAIVQVEGDRQAEREIPMTMKDWSEHLDSILTMSGEQLLQGNGTISNIQAMEKAEKI